MSTDTFVKDLAHEMIHNKKSRSSNQTTRRRRQRSSNGDDSPTNENTNNKRQRPRLVPTTEKKMKINKATKKKEPLGGTLNQRRCTWCKSFKSRMRCSECNQPICDYHGHKNGEIRYCFDEHCRNIHPDL